jgi:hypothetical protein
MTWVLLDPDRQPGLAHRFVSIDCCTKLAAPERFIFDRSVPTSLSCGPWEWLLWLP